MVKIRYFVENDKVNKEISSFIYRTLEPLNFKTSHQVKFADSYELKDSEVHFIVHIPQHKE